MASMEAIIKCFLLLIIAFYLPYGASIHQPSNEYTMEDRPYFSKYQTKYLYDGPDEPLQECDPPMRIPRGFLLHIGHLDLRIGQILNVSTHSQNSGFFVLTVDIGNKTINNVFGLREYFKASDLINQTVPFLLNVRAVHIQGHISEAVMPVGRGPRHSPELLIAPKGSRPGDPITVKHYRRRPIFEINVQSHAYSMIAKNCYTDGDARAAYRNDLWMVRKQSNFEILGPVKATSAFIKIK